jgi:hypothetical protein
VGVPGIEFFTWPDQWYHADKDLPENADPTEMKRVAFIGAATAWVSANLTDDLLAGLLDEVMDFAYARVAERGLPRALREMEEVPKAAGEPMAVSTEGLSAALAWSSTILEAAVAREREALGSIRDIASGSAAADRLIADRELQWDLYGEHLLDLVRDYAGARADVSGVPSPSMPEATAEDLRYAEVVPRLAEGIRGREFYLSRFAPYQAYLEDHPGALEGLGLGRGETTQILNFVDGKRSVTEIRDRAAAWSGRLLELSRVARYLEILAEVGWIDLEETGLP